MTTLDDFFSKPTEPLHPRLRNWKARLAEPGASATLEVSPPEAEFGQAQPEMHLQFVKDGNLLPLETVPWDDDLNAGLLHQVPKPVRAISPEQEAERFALGLRAALRKAEREFGDGYFNAVLLELLKDSDLTGHAEIAEVLRHAYAPRPSHEGRGYDTCREMIAGAISGRAQELTGPLRYPQDQAKRVLVSALARYLDQRFSVSRRRRLGLL
jgi:hypothetical protein